jgi:hypothetical protein
MTAPVTRVFALIAIIMSSAAPSFGQQRLMPGSHTFPGIELRPLTGTAPDATEWGHLSSRSRHRWRAELQAARALAEDWLRDAGMSLLEERDADGRRTYAVLSGKLAESWPMLRLRARVGRPQLSSGMRPRREAPAVGITFPWKTYTLELEGLDDRDLGYSLLGVFRWGDASRRVQYGVALPVALEDGPSVGALLQVRVRLGN